MKKRILWNDGAPSRNLSRDDSIIAYAKIKVDGFKVLLCKHYDNDPDTSWLGEFTQDKPDHANYLIMDPDNLPGDWRDWKRGYDGLPYPVYFVPGNGMYDLPAGKHGGPNAEARKYAVQDRDRLLKLWRNDFCFIGISATVLERDAPHGNGSRHCAWLELGQDSVWGIESDSEDSYIDSTAYDMAHGAVQDAKRNIDKLCELRSKVSV